MEIVASDITILDLLRKTDSLTVAELASSMGVTATAIRQRLNRLMAKDYIDRTSHGYGRGRPTHRYRLTPAGRRKTGENFADLAIALWQELRAIKDVAVRRGLMLRISRRLAELYGGHIAGLTIEERMEGLAQLYSERRIPASVEQQAGLPVLKAYACPYPELAEQDRSLCAMERIMFSEVLGREVRLNECRLDGANCCTFELPAGESVGQPAG